VALAEKRGREEKKKKGKEGGKDLSYYHLSFFMPMRIEKKGKNREGRKRREGEKGPLFLSSLLISPLRLLTLVLWTEGDRDPLEASFYYPVHLLRGRKGGKKRDLSSRSPSREGRGEKGFRHILLVEEKGKEREKASFASFHSIGRGEKGGGKKEEKGGRKISSPHTFLITSFLTFFSMS